MKSKKRADGPASPVGVYGVPSTGPAGPVWPEWLKYGPIDRITGVLAFAGSDEGRSTSACSLVPSASVIEAWLQVEPGGGGSAFAGAERARAATTATAGASRVRMETDNAPAARSLRSLVERQRGEDDVDGDQRPALERHRLTVTRD